jgi:hypothetical protein
LRGTNGNEESDAPVLETILITVETGVLAERVYGFDDDVVLIWPERAFAQPENICLFIVERDGMQAHGRQRCAQLPAQ